MRKIIIKDGSNNWVIAFSSQNKKNSNGKSFALYNLSFCDYIFSNTASMHLQDATTLFLNGIVYFFSILVIFFSIFLIILRKV